ncbi:hypothetical protein GS636_06715 [Ruegeria sp. HKCCD4884]|uniref:hypothetical protein n=1 Tax=Ruegeria sp. HKCCD4884 TaxID=2683022 RepID=UPI001491C525|nr:hypothetical protein [Ruegeria sp. HKCCD4884]NOD92473.1 hypothetical protein [Ruegeria sp. HKCCD4884]
MTTRNASRYAKYPDNPLLAKQRGGGFNPQLLNMYLSCLPPDVAADYRAMVDIDGSDPAARQRRYYWRKKVLRELTEHFGPMLAPDNWNFRFGCFYCGTEFTPHRKGHVFCTPTCRKNSHRFWKGEKRRAFKLSDQYERANAIIAMALGRSDRLKRIKSRFERIARLYDEAHT